MFRARLVMAILTCGLSGCPGGWREKMISTYSPEPVPIDEVATFHGYGVGKAIAPGYLVNDQLYVQMFSVNLHDLALKSPSESSYMINGLISSADQNVTLDTQSFTLLRNGHEPATVARVISTRERPMVTAYGHEPRTACGFWSDKFEVKESRIPVPSFSNKEPWPPENIDNSVACLSLEFDLSIRDVPPQKHFQLRFTYYKDDVPREVTLYFYPLKYTIFEH